MIRLSYPQIGREEEKALLEVLRSGCLVQGPKVEKFEKEFAQHIGVKYAAATSSGTSALHLALLALNLGKGDEVITSPFSFIASANSIIYVGAKPVFVDIDETFNLNPNLIEEKINSKTKAILVVHLFGLSADMFKINKIAKKYRLKVIEDASQAPGARIGKRYVGSFGDIACFSFYATKNITTAEGGMVVSNNKMLIEKVKVLRNHGSGKKYHHDLLGYNYRMTDLCAALGLVQLKKLDFFNSERVKNAAYLNQKLFGSKLILPKLENPAHHVFHQYTVRVRKPFNREKVINHLWRNGIEVGVFYPIPIHRQKFYRASFGQEKLPVAERVAKEVLSLPIHPGLRKKDLDFIIQKVLEVTA